MVGIPLESRQSLDLEHSSKSADELRSSKLCFGQLRCPAEMSLISDISNDLRIKNIRDPNIVRHYKIRWNLII